MEEEVKDGVQNDQPAHKSNDKEPNAENLNDKSGDSESATKNRSSRRQATKKLNESKNTSAGKQNKEIDNQVKTTKTREANKSKEKQSLKDIVKETLEQDEPMEVDRTSATKSTRKAADKSTKASATKKASSIVIISTSITEIELKLLDKFAKKFNAQIVTNFTNDITHLVTLETKPGSRLTTRTLKYLKSLITHKWLLDFKWIKDCLDNDKLVDESDYELLGITKQLEGNLGAPKRSRENSTTNLFEGKSFYIDGKFSSKSGLSKEDYQELVKVGGGDLIENEKEMDKETYVIIEATHMLKSKYKSRQKALSTTDFLNCVSDFKFDL